MSVTVLSSLSSRMLLISIHSHCIGEPKDRWLLSLKSWTTSAVGHVVGTGKHPGFCSEANGKKKALSFADKEVLDWESVKLEEPWLVVAPGVLNKAVGARFSEVVSRCNRVHA